MSDKDDSDELPEMPPARMSSADVPPDAPAPRAARFGEGKEGRGARRERGLSEPRHGFFERIGLFWRDVRAELKRLTWPTVKEVRSATIITIVAVIFFAVYLWAVDQGLAFLVIQLERFVNWIFGAA